MAVLALALLSRPMHDGLHLLPPSHEAALDIRFGQTEVTVCKAHL